MRRPPYWNQPGGRLHCFSWRRVCDVTAERSSGGPSVRDLVLVILQHVVRLAPVRDESIAVSRTMCYLTGQGSAQDVLGIFFSYLLLRKQLCMILIMNAAASFSLIWGLNLPLLKVNPAKLAIDAWETFSPTVYQTPQAVGYGLTHSTHVPYIMKEMNMCIFFLGGNRD